MFSSHQNVSPLYNSNMFSSHRYVSPLVQFKYVLIPSKCLSSCTIQICSHNIKMSLLLYNSNMFSSDQNVSPLVQFKYVLIPSKCLSCTIQICSHPINMSLLLHNSNWPSGTKNWLFNFSAIYVECLYYYILQVYSRLLNWNFTVFLIWFTFKRMDTCLASYCTLRSME